MNKANYSKQQITEALIDLLQKTSIEDITITSLVTKAHVSRNAFYNNYQSVEDVLKEACVNSFMNATDVAEYLVKKGCPFRDAHFIVGNLVGKCVNEDKFLQDLTLSEFKEQSGLFEDDIYEVLHVTTGMNKKNMTASPKEEIVKRYIDEILDEIK